MKSKQPLTNYYWSHIKRGARHRGHDFVISREYAWELFLKQDGKCALSGKPIEFATTAKGWWAGETTASLDRIDSDKGYLYGNVQWTHKDINRMKHGHQQDYFISLCQEVANYSCTKGEI